jgi:hypothetical protein
MTEERTCQRPGCDRAIPLRKRKDARWCSRSCEAKAQRAAMRRAAFEDEHGPVPSYDAEPGRVGSGVLANESLTELHARAARPPSAPELAVPGHGESDYAEDTRFSEMAGQAVARPTPPGIMREWRAYGRRHGTEHPEQSWDRVQRQQAQADANRARDAHLVPHMAEDCFDRRTVGNVGRRGQESRRLNAGHQELGAFDAQEWDVPEVIHYGAYTGMVRAPAAGHDSDHAWNMKDG